MMKKVLITGADSYIGTGFEKHVNTYYPDQLEISTIDMRDDNWKNADFSGYDIIFHVAGIAHADVSKVSEETRAKYYAVNTDLAIDTAKKARSEGVKQFVFMSSIIIYGDSAPLGQRKVIRRDTEPHPSNFYGDSKWQADKGVRELGDDNFTVTVLRPPMIYGKGSKGNYPVLSKLAGKLPVFPDIDNERSMLYIENLCEFLAQIMIRGDGGIFWPQNGEYVKTSDMVRMIGEVTGRGIRVSKLWNPAVKLASLIPGKTRNLANKAFGSLSIDKELSEYDFKYRLYDLKTSIARTETDKHD